MYEDELIEKIATRAWKKNYGELGDASKQKLLDSDIHNYKKELKGLNKGTKNILKSVGAKESRGIIPASLAAIKNVRLIKNSGDGGKDAATSYLSRIGGGLTSDRKVFGGKGISIIFPRRNIAKNMANIVDSSPSTINANARALYPKDKLSRKYLDAIYRRHEADEARSMRRKDNPMLRTKSGKLVGNKNLTNGGHLDPSVMYNESANAAIAPKQARDFAKHIRDATGESFTWSINGLEHGKNAVVNKRQLGKLRKQIGQENIKGFASVYGEPVGPKYGLKK
jgi:hypothetical protein